MQGSAGRRPHSGAHFDILPLLIRDPEGRSLYQLPPESVRQVGIAHPVKPELAALMLKWYAVPVVCDMILTIGGIDYPCAPFNGYYIGTEIASRNFLNIPRYNLMEPIAQALEVDRADPLYKDRVSTELNRAVLFSFAQAGCAMVDHHEASDQFIQFIHREKAAGRMPSGNWSWIVPPEASATCPVFHQSMRDYHDVPNFYRSGAVDGTRWASATPRTTSTGMCGASSESGNGSARGCGPRTEHASGTPTGGRICGAGRAHAAGSPASLLIPPGSVSLTRIRLH